MRILISLHPFAEAHRAPLELLQRSGHTLVVNPVGRRMTEADLVTHAADCAAIICGTEPISSKVIAAAPALKVVSRVGSGCDSVDLAAAAARDIVVAFVPDGPVESVAELTLGLILDSLRGISRTDRHMRGGEWVRPLGKLLGGRTVGIAGVSRIGGTVARKLAALGCKVIGHDLNPHAGIGVPFVSKNELLQQSEILLLHLSYTPQTRNWLGAAELAQMPAGAVLVCTARGGLIDEAALHAALSSGKLAHAALDVFEKEPYQGPLRDLPNVTLTAHIGSMTVEARIKMELDACQNVLDVLAGREPAHRITAP